jgi:dTDP-4-dehydrorhamnose 3,5-epimerase
VQYKIDNLYDRASERGLRWDDADIGIDWNIGQPFLSAKDADLPFYKDFISPF